MYDNDCFRTYINKHITMSKKLTVHKDIPSDFSEVYGDKDRIAVDTELHGLRLYRDQICLVQLCDDEGHLCLVQPENGKTAPQLKKLMEEKAILKVFHYALSDVAFFRTSLNWVVRPFCCTKVMSKLIRTYSQSHGLKDLHKELLGVQMEKEQQQTNWSTQNLTQKQMEYAANDVLRLLEIHDHLIRMMVSRSELSGGRSVTELNELAQSMLQGFVELIVNGYGDRDGGWETSLFSH